MLISSMNNCLDVKYSFVLSLHISDRKFANKTREYKYIVGRIVIIQIANNLLLLNILYKRSL